MPVTIVTDNCSIPIQHFFYVLKICAHFVKKKYMHTFECVAEEYVSFRTHYHAIIAKLNASCDHKLSINIINFLICQSSNHR